MDKRTARHPCYSESAHHFFARMHMAVAPGCNIQCAYCNRKYDCANESRPGVVSERLKPEEALRKVRHAAVRMKELSVIGIAGPGDALANPGRTFKTLRLIRERFPDLALCLSTNGLKLPDHAGEIADLGVGHVTVTVNTFKPETARRIYEWVAVSGRKSNSQEAMEKFLAAQREGIRALVEKGILVKVNSILIPGINDEELPFISKKLKLMGVFIHNIMPLISRPEHGTKLGVMGWPEPAAAELEAVREACGDMKQMAHCRQCRADAAGRLGKDGFAGFTKEALASAPAPEDNGAAGRAEWKRRVGEFLARRAASGREGKPGAHGGFLVAACTKGLGLVNQHFGHAKEFFIYRVAGGEARLVNVRKVESYCGGPAECGGEDPLERIIETISGCHAVVCLRVGYGPAKRLAEAGVKPVTDLPYTPIERAVVEAASRLAAKGAAPTMDESAMEKRNGA
ncbi:MAG: nitrogenase cofactor biosynthesis protein NifB [Candidatus Nitrospinota bacterium M3_3B_026]